MAAKILLSPSRTLLTTYAAESFLFANCGIPATGASATAASLSFDLTGLSTISTGSSFAKFERTFDLLFSNPITLSQENGPSLNLSQVTDVPSGDFCRSKKTISL